MPDTIILSVDNRVVGRLLSTDARQVLPSLKSSRTGPAEVAPSKMLCGAFDSSAVMSWVGGTLDHVSTRRNATLIAIDQAKKSAIVAEMSSCLVSEIMLPALDKNSSADAAMQLTIMPGRVVTKTSGVDIRKALTAPALKGWKVSDFQFTVDGMETAAYVSTVNSLLIKQGIKKRYIGADRFPELEPTKLETGSVVVTIAKQWGDDFFKWLEQARDNEKSRRAERAGRLLYVARDKSMVAAITLKELGISSVSISSANIRIEMYCGKMEMEPTFVGRAL